MNIVASGAGAATGAVTGGSSGAINGASIASDLQQYNAAGGKLAEKLVEVALKAAQKAAQLSGNKTLINLTKDINKVDDVADAIEHSAVGKKAQEIGDALTNAEFKATDKVKDAITGEKTPNDASPNSKGNVTYDELAKPDANELKAGQEFADQGYDVTYRETASDKGISGTRTSDLYVDGVGDVDVYTPQSTTKTDRILSSIEKKSNQADGIIVQMDMSAEEMQSMASRLWGKPNAQNIKTLFFQNLKGKIFRFDRK